MPVRSRQPNPFAGRRVVVTGGLGFIGSNLAGRLVRLGADVLLVDSLIPQYGGNLFNIRGIERRVTVNIADVRDPHGLPHLLRGADFLFNLAGQTSHMDSMENPGTDLAINCEAQLSILECCRVHNPEVRIVYASTRQIYGRPEFLPVTEAHPIRPVDINGIHKAAAEQYHLLYHNVHGLHTVALRLTKTIGPRMRVKDARQTFVGIWIRRLIEGDPTRYGAVNNCATSPLSMTLSRPCCSRPLRRRRWGASTTSGDRRSSACATSRGSPSTSTVRDGCACAGSPKSAAGSISAIITRTGR